jgi:glycerol-3-phosphate cytidylyltransferase-like family protein
MRANPSKVAVLTTAFNELVAMRDTLQQINEVNPNLVIRSYERYEAIRSAKAVMTVFANSQDFQHKAVFIKSQIKYIANDRTASELHDTLQRVLFAIHTTYTMVYRGVKTL